eukprot:7298771-Pyramimonas_sp.AAC.1
MQDVFRKLAESLHVFFKYFNADVFKASTGDPSGTTASLDKQEGLGIGGGSNLFCEALCLSQPQPDQKRKQRRCT